MVDWIDGEPELDAASGVQFITLKEEFSIIDEVSKELYVRECTRDIYESLKQVRKSASDESPNVHAAILGQPGIGKSCSLYYFAYRFLREDDVDSVHKNASSLNFFLVKNGKDAEVTESTIYVSKLLLEHMPMDNKDELDVSIIVGTKSREEPFRKKRKLETLDMPKNWSIRYITAPIHNWRCLVRDGLKLDLKRFQNELTVEFTMFKTRQQFLQQPTDAPEVAQ